VSDGRRVDGHADLHRMVKKLCAVKRRASSAGANPAGQLSFQPVAAGRLSVECEGVPVGAPCKRCRFSVGISPIWQAVAPASSNRSGGGGNNPRSDPAAKYLPDSVTQNVRVNGNTTSLTTHLTYDQNGNVLSSTDPMGNVTRRVAYDAYGNVLGTTYDVTNPPVTKILYVGQQVDVALGQYYNRARYYATATGRFRTEFEDRVDETGRWP
jgi:RHS repeat-associated protein